MKMISTIITALSISTCVMAHGPVSTLSVSRHDGSKIRIEMDGRPVQGYQSFYQFRNLAPGKHHIRIFTFRKRSALAVIFGWPPSEHLLYSAAIQLRPGTATQMVIGRDGTVGVREYPLSGILAPEYESARDGDRQAGRVRSGDFSNRAPFYRPMEGDRFRQLLHTLRTERRERRRLSLAIGSLNGQFISTEQLRQMLHLFRHDNHRLELAKSAYPRVVDKQQFRQVYGDLNDRHSREEMAAFLRRNQ